MPILSTRAFQRIVRLSHCRLVSTKSMPPVSPRPSASLVVVNSHNEILLLQRNPKSSNFAGIHVFPGGNADMQDANNFKMTAIRETFEESGLLMVKNRRGILDDPEKLYQAREDLHSRKKDFPDFLDKNGLQPELDALFPFMQWVTPTTAPVRFHTHFFVVFLSSSDSVGFTAGIKQDQVATPDGGKEVISARFVSPSVALSQFANKTIALMPPQWYILEVLRNILQSPRTTKDERAKVEALSRGPFGRQVIHPTSGPRHQDGRSTFLYDGDELLGGKKGRRHRLYYTITQKRAVDSMELDRNFDIYTQVDEPVHAKL